MSVSTISVVVEAKLRKKDLSCDHHNSMELKSGEYGDKQINFAPTTAIIGLLDRSLWAGKLSLHTTVLTTIETLKTLP